MDQSLKFTSPSTCILSPVATIFSPSCFLSKVRGCRMAGRALRTLEQLLWLLFPSEGEREPRAMLAWGWWAALTPHSSGFHIAPRAVLAEIPGSKSEPCTPPYHFWALNPPCRNKISFSFHAGEALSLNSGSTVTAGGSWCVCSHPCGSYTG